MEKKLLKSCDKVKNILEKYSKSRDDNRLLEGIFWMQQIEEMGLNIDSLSMRDFLRLYADHKLREAGVIDRDSRAIQKANEPLRGKDYYTNRGIEKQDSIKSELKEVKERVELKENYEKKKVA